MIKPFFILLIIATHAMAKDERIIKIPKHLCSNVDVRIVRPSLQNILSTPRNQGLIGWCYGFAAADLISAEVGEVISSAHVSSIYNKRVASNFFWRIGYSIGDLFKKDDIGEVYEGGFIGKAIKNTLSAGSVCREQDMPYDQKYLGQFKDIMQGLDDLSQKLEKNLISEEAALKSLRNILDADLFPQIDLSRVLTDIQSKNLNKVVEDIMRNNCGENLVSLPDMRVSSKNKPRLKQDSEENFNSSVRWIGKFFQSLNDKLSQGKPVGISYNVNRVTKQSGGHASVIMARRWKNNQCEYKIRNSWGDSCRSYKKGIDCDESEGSFWVSDDTLYKMTKSITYIE
jgi:hypothetical protein